MMWFVVFESAGGLVKTIELCVEEDEGEDSLPDEVLGDNGASWRIASGVGGVVAMGEFGACGWGMVGLRDNIVWGGYQTSVDGEIGSRCILVDRWIRKMVVMENNMTWSINFVGFGI